MRTLNRIDLLLVSALLISVGSFQVIAQQLPSPNAILRVAWSSDASLIARIYANGSVEVIQATSGQVEFSYASGLPLRFGTVAWNPIDSTKFAAGIERNVYVWDLTTGATIFTFLAGDADGITSIEELTYSEAIVSLSWTLDGARLATLSLGGIIRIWNTTNGTLLLDSWINQSISVAWNPSGTQLVTGAGLGIRTIDPITGNIQMLGNNSFQPGSITSVDWSPDGTKIANGTVFGDVTIWNAITGERILYFRENTNSITEVTWAPDSQRIASAGWDGAVRVWNTVSGQPLGVIQNTGPMFTVDWSPDGTPFIAGGESSSGETVMEIIQIPVANAGPDQTVTDSDNSGAELVTLNGSGSTDSDGTIVSYSWSENGVEIATGISPQVSLAVGTHTITLTVTDNDGATSGDIGVVTVNPGPTPTPTQQ